MLRVNSVKLGYSQAILELTVCPERPCESKQEVRTARCDDREADVRGPVKLSAVPDTATTAQFCLQKSHELWYERKASGRLT